MRKKRIALVLATGIGPSGGVRAMATFLYETIKQYSTYEPTLVSVAASSRDANSVRLLSPRSWYQGVRKSEGLWNGIPYTHVGSWWAELEFQRVRPRPELTKLLQEFDLIQVVAGTPAIAWAISQVDKPKCIFVATTIQQERATVLQNMSGLKKLWLTLMTAVNAKIEKHALPQMSHIFAESDYTRDLLLDYIPQEKISVGVPGVDTELFHPAPHYNPNSYILSVGRFTDPRKNVRLLLKAYRNLHSKSSQPPKLILAGRGGLSGQDRDLIVQWGLTEDIEIRQDASLMELAKLYREASLFVLSSNEEGLGIVILEAMASGLPVVSTRCGGPETAVSDGDTGYLTPIGDAKLMAAKMQLLLKSPELSYRMAAKSRQVALARFSMRAARQVYLDIFDDFLNRSRGSQVEKTVEVS